MFTESENVERRKFHFDKSVNVGNLVAIILLIVSLITYLRGIYDATKDIQFKVNLMWTDYIKTRK